MSTAALPPISGDIDDITEPADLAHRRVSFILARNGTCVAGVRVTRIEWYLGTPRLRYQLPDCLGESAVELGGIGHLHVLREPVNAAGPLVYIGDHDIRTNQT